MNYLLWPGDVSSEVDLKTLGARWLICPLIKTITFWLLESQPRVCQQGSLHRRKPCFIPVLQGWLGCPGNNIFPATILTACKSLGSSLKGLQASALTVVWYCLKKGPIPIGEIAFWHFFQSRRIPSTITYHNNTEMYMKPGTCVLFTCLSPCRLLQNGDEKFLINCNLFFMGSQEDLSSSWYLHRLSR